LAKHGIDYCHVKQAGNPSQNRKTARSANDCLARYKEYLKNNRGCLDQLMLLIRNADNARRPACITCYERIWTDCHRSVLIAELAALSNQLITVHMVPSLPITKKQRLVEPANDSLLKTSFLTPLLLPFS